MPSGHTMVFISVYLTFVRLINTKYQYALQMGIFGMFSLVSFNRAQMQVHSFDQLLDGAIQGLLFSDFLSSQKSQNYFKLLCDQMSKQNITWLLTRPLLIFFLALNAFCWICYFSIDHQLSEENKRITKITCNFELRGSEVADVTFCMLNYSFCFVGAYIGCYISSTPNQDPKPSIFNIKSYISCFIRSIPSLILTSITYLNWNSQIFSVKVVGKYLVPPFLTMLYFYGFSDSLIKILNKTK